MEAMVSRRNSINGRLYRDDPTIFAWDLMNEPRCDCFPDEIPAPPELVSCRPECAQKMQVSASSLSVAPACRVPAACAGMQTERDSAVRPRAESHPHQRLCSAARTSALTKHISSRLLGAGAESQRHWPVRLRCPCCCGTAPHSAALLSLAHLILTHQL